MTLTPYTLNPATDLELTREVPVAPALVWRAWTEPELIKQWFTPKPWRTTHCEIDLRPGGRFLTVMKGPDDDETSDDVGEAGCFLEIVPGERLVWTAVLGPDFRPQATDLPFTAIIELDETASGGTRYRGRHAPRCGDGQAPRRDGLCRGLGCRPGSARRPHGGSVARRDLTAASQHGSGGPPPTVRGWPASPDA